MPNLSRRVVILGGGLSGMAVAHALVESGWRDISIVEADQRLGGLAGSFLHNGTSYPLGYHHVLDRDQPLLFVLDLLGILRRIRWKKIEMAFELQGRLYRLGSPLGALTLPLPLRSKIGFAHLMCRAYFNNDWSDWMGQSSADLVDRWGGRTLREMVFEPLSEIRFRRGCDQISAAWLGTRLNYREGSAPLGYEPRTNWTHSLCEAYTDFLRQRGVKSFVGTRIAGLRTEGRQVTEALLNGGSVPGDIFVSALPAPAYHELLRADRTVGMDTISYSALISLIGGTRQAQVPNAYWTNFLDSGRAASGLFSLSALNSEISEPGETCLNFVTHLKDADEPLLCCPDDELLAEFSKDFLGAYGTRLRLDWYRTSRIKRYAPVFSTDYSNPPPKSTTFLNMYFAGNYRAHPTIASTGTAIASGFESADFILAEAGQRSDLCDRSKAFEYRPARD